MARVGHAVNANPSFLARAKYDLLIGQLSKYVVMHIYFPSK